MNESQLLIETIENHNLWEKEIEINRIINTKGYTKSRIKNQKMKVIIAILCFISTHSFGQKKIDLADKRQNNILLNVGTYRLHFKVIHGTLPAVVFESGFGEDATQWDKIQLQLSKNIPNAIISYDRAGMGKSELPDSKYNLKKEVEDLRRGLKLLNYDKEVVLVGHSFGGLLINQYYKSNYNSVKGLLYVDPSTVAFYIKTKTIEEVEGNVKSIDLTESYSKSEQSMHRIWREFEPTLNTLNRIKIKKDIPKYLISSTEDFFSIIPENKIWRDEHVIYSKKIGAKHIIATGSAHDIPNEKPEVVIETIYKILNEIK